MVILELFGCRSGTLYAIAANTPMTQASPTRIAIPTSKNLRGVD
jgi:hypothetical protein